MATKQKINILMIATFLVVISLFLYFALLVVFDALVIIFNFQSFRQLATLDILLGFLVGSFVASVIIGMRYYNKFTRLYYKFSAIFMGFFVYLFFID